MYVAKQDGKEPKKFSGLAGLIVHEIVKRGSMEVSDIKEMYPGANVQRPAEANVQPVDSCIQRLVDRGVFYEDVQRSVEANVQKPVESCIQRLVDSGVFYKEGSVIKPTPGYEFELQDVGLESVEVLMERGMSAEEAENLAFVC
jgi:hypothetical protein